MQASARTGGSRTGRRAARLAAAVVVTVVGVGACALEPGRGVADRTPGGAPGIATGASATPAPTRSQPASPTGAAGTPATPPSSAAPRPTGTPSRTPTSAPATAGCPQGEYQREVETLLTQLGGFGRLVVDGRQSGTDCTAIKKFQSRYGIRPATGRAGPTTRAVAQRLVQSDPARCGAGAGTTICVDLTRQTVWVMRDGSVLMKPTVTRTGMRGYATPAGSYTINWRNLREWSVPWKVWLPYWQHFHDGMGFHETTTYLHNAAIGSHGCVNLLPADARRIWDIGRVGTAVKVFGRRPGT